MEEWLVWLADIQCSLQGLLDDDTEFIFSGSDDDFDFSADDYDPLEREQGNHDHNS